MAFSERLINLRHCFRNNTEAFNKKGATNPLKVGSEMFEDEMFIGSIFCSDLSGSQKVLVRNQQKQDVKKLYERFGMATNHE